MVRNAHRQTMLLALPGAPDFIGASTLKEEVEMPGGRRELIEPHPGDKRYVRRNPDGTFKESDDVSKSLSRDVRQPARRSVQSGQGDRGDQRRKRK